MGKNIKTTSNKLATKAAKILTNPNASDIAKKLAGSTLSQANKGNQTGSEMETIASKVLQSPKYSDDTKSMAASILSQSNKER
ncbi:MAG: hypothetical protein ACOVOQ_16220 [Flavobacterium sp.]